jgi:hypothetical protein
VPTASYLNGFELDLDVPPADGDLLIYNTDTSAWENSKTLTGNYTVSGSLTIRENLTVLGSASVTYISESTLNIGTNLITVNTINPGARFGGLAVIDSGSSPQISASFLYDSIKDEFVFVHHSIPTTSSVFLQGPETYNDLGNEIYLTANRIPKGTGIEHLNDSNISDDGSVVSINSNTEITGSLVVSNGITGSLEGTASFSTTASFAISASWAPSPFLRNQTNASSTDIVSINQSIFNPSNLKVLSTSIFIIDEDADYYVLGDLINSGSLIVSGTLKIGGALYNSGSITGPGIIE